MSPESTTHQSNALSSTARHLTQRDFPGSDEVFQKIKALIEGKSNENIPQIQKLLEEMQTAYSKRISNLLSNIQNGSIRIRDAHQEVQQMLHEIQVFKGKEMPEEVAAVTEAITSMCDQISKKVQAVKELINETPVAEPVTMAAVAVPAVTPAPAPAPAPAPTTAVPTAVAAPAPEIDQAKETLLATWKREIHQNTRADGLIRKLLVTIAEESLKGERTTKASLAVLFGIDERTIAYTIYNWRQEGRRLSFTLDKQNPYRIYSKNQGAPVIATLEPATVVISQPAEATDTSDTQKAQWREYIRANSENGTFIRKALEHLIATYKTGTSLEELTITTGQSIEKTCNSLRVWKSRKGDKIPFIIAISTKKGIRILPKDHSVEDIAESAPTVPPPIANIIPPTAAAPLAPRMVPPPAAAETSTAPIAWLNEINRIASPDTPNRKILIHIAKNHGKEVAWPELLQISGEEVGTQQIEKRVGRWPEKFEKNAPFKIVTSTSGAKMVSKDAPEEASPVQTPKDITATTVAAAIATVAEAPLTEAETSGHQGKAMNWISKLPPSQRTEKAAYEALAGKFGTEVTKEELMDVERAYNRERMIGRIDMISFVYRLDNDRVSFTEMPFTVVKSGKGFKMMQKETKKAQTGAPLPETTPEQVRKEKAMRWFNQLNLDSSTIMYGFLKTLAENPSVKISDRKILEGARKINPKMTTHDLYTLFSNEKKKGKIKSATYPASYYTLDIEMKTQGTDDADKYFFKLHEMRL